MTEMIAILRIRGPIHVKTEIADTLTMLHLHRGNYCAVFKDSPSLRGMLQKAKDYITYGKITEETYTELKKLKDGKKSFFRLNPPRGGFERKGVKTPFIKGGALGDRGEKMGDLIAKMLPVKK
jgi:large subunit ribosomal protein L30